MKTTHDNSDFLSYSNRLRDFILKTGLPFQKAPEVLGMTGPQFMRWWNSFDHKIVSSYNLTHLAKYFNLSESQILFGFYDEARVRSFFFQNSEVGLGKYTLNQFSCTRSSAHIFKYLSLTRGRHFADKILNSLQVSPAIYQNLDNKISLDYFMDLLEALEQHGVTPAELDILAGALFLSLSGTKLGNEFEKAKNYYDCYLILLNNLSLFDENFEYSSEIDSSQYRMSAFLPYDKHIHIQFNAKKVEKLHRYRQILVGWFPYLSGLPPILPKVSHQYLTDGIKTTTVVHFFGTSSRPLFLCSGLKEH